MRLLKAGIVLTFVTAWCSLAAAPVQAEHGHHGSDCVVCRDPETPRPDLFANYYLPGVCGTNPAQLYIAPHPVPPVVGHTYITYQPLMPHELLYQHHRTYYRYYNNGRGMTRTSVHWYRPPLVSAIGGVARHFRIAR